VCCYAGCRRVMDGRILSGLLAGSRRLRHNDLSPSKRLKNRFRNSRILASAQGGEETAQKLFLSRFLAARRFWFATARPFFSWRFSFLY
jgi:hypothetical protein